MEKQLTQQEFRKLLVEQQLPKLNCFRDWRMMDENGRRVYRDWIEVRTTNPAAAEALISRVLELDELPTLSVFRAIWLELFPPKATASQNCQYCNGTGWEIVENACSSGAKRCRCGGTVPAGAVA